MSGTCHKDQVLIIVDEANHSFLAVSSDLAL